MECCEQNMSRVFGIVEKCKKQDMKGKKVSPWYENRLT